MLDSLNQTITDLLGPAGPLLLLGGLGVILIVIALPTLMKREKDPLERLKEQRLGHTAANSPQALRRGTKNATADKLERFAGYLEPKTAAELSATRLKLMRAGYHAKDSVRLFHFIQFAMALGALGFGMLLALIKSGQQDVTPTTLAMYVLLPAAFAYYLPQYWVTRRIQTRQQEITEGFPDALDMMLVCVEAGQSLDQSIIRVANEAKAGYPALGEEFELVAHEVKAGKERAAVLRDMSERVNLPDITSFCTTLIQSSSFGTSIADALRIYSSEMRDKRVMRAEEKANTIPTKLTLGTMLFTVPPLLVILIGPSLYTFASQMTGG
ncbi:MAG: type II secretion system F family protein [Cypionkella sp.]|jgi:tight adherence protein C|nr:type II secretion system F family protein [Cypionkella sp.]